MRDRLGEGKLSRNKRKRRKTRRDWKDQAKGQVIKLNIKAKGTKVQEVTTI